jgi:7,8-dihydroneopterin aldolase/epimerase/oxygenase
MMNRGESRTGRIRLEEMVFHAYHGVYPEEQQSGNQFSVDISFDIDIQQASQSDQLEHTADYTGVYKIVAREMLQRSSLLEHLATRIIQAVKLAYPATRMLEIKIRKLNPPVGGDIKSVSITVKEEIRQ